MVDDNLNRLIKLTPDVKQRLQDNMSKMPELKNTLASLKKMGIDTTNLENQLKYAEETSKELLKTFG